MPDRAVTLVPAFLSRGYHVTTDIPDHVEASGHPDVTVTEALGPGPQLVRVLADRLIESGWRRDDSVVLAAAGTSDPCAQRDLHTMATWLSAITGCARRAGVRRHRDATGGRRGGPFAPTRRAAGRGGVVPAVGGPVSGPVAGQRRRCGDRTARHASRPGAADREQVPPRPRPCGGLTPEQTQTPPEMTDYGGFHVCSRAKVRRRPRRGRHSCASGIPAVKPRGRRGSCRRQGRRPAS